MIVMQMIVTHASYQKGFFDVAKTSTSGKTCEIPKHSTE